MPPGVLCRAVQELCRCLTPVIESGNQFDLDMLNVAERDPVAHTSAERVHIADTREEEPISVPAPSYPLASEPEEAVQPEELALVPREDHHAPWVYPFMGRWVWTTLLEEADWPVSMSIGAQLGLTSMESAANDHIPLPSNGHEVQCQYQSQDHCLHVPGPDVPTTGPAPILGPDLTHLPRLRSSEQMHSAFWVTHEQL